MDKKQIADELHSLIKQFNEQYKKAIKSGLIVNIGQTLQSTPNTGDTDLLSVEILQSL